MHQPLPIAHKEGMGLGDSEIIHCLRLVDKRHRLDGAISFLRPVASE